MKNILLLGSQSLSRQRLLKEANIPFKFIGHNADETACVAGLSSPQEIVQTIAREKMNHVCLPSQGEAGNQIEVA